MHVGSLHPEQSKVDAVQSMPASETKTQLWAILGLSGYYQKFIQYYILHHGIATN